MTSTVGPTDVDAVVVGAGFSGLYTLHRLRAMGLSVTVFEAGDGVGGTWHWNRYPGARVDVESMSYSYSFSSELQQEWSWTHTFAERWELKKYADHVADRFDLRPDIRFETRVTAASYDDDTRTWRTTTDDGSVTTSRYLITAVGPLSASNTPPFPGLEDFRGEAYHSSRWPEEGVDLAGKRVGVVGTGSTGIQIVPVVAREAAHLTVFQRTPQFTLPIYNAPMNPEFERGWKARYDEHRAVARMTPGGSTSVILNDFSALSVSDEERERIYEKAWESGGSAVLRSFNDLMIDRAANDTAADFVRRKIRTIVRDPEVAEKLSPRDYPIGAKRICMDSGYYETFNRPNVTLVDVRADPVQRITPDGLQTTSASYDLDVLIFATGFDAVTGALFDLGITGRGGTTLRAKWAEGPRLYLGAATSGFPNLFTVTGPGSPAVLANGFTSIEQHVDFVCDVIGEADERGAAGVEATPEAEVEWSDHVNDVAARTLYTEADSWYLGANIPGRPRVFMLYAGGAGAFRRRCDAVIAAGFPGFVFS